MDKDIEYYLSAFEKMKRAIMRGVKAPHKPLLLLAINFGNSYKSIPKYFWMVVGDKVLYKAFALAGRMADYYYTQGDALG